MPKGRQDNTHYSIYGATEVSSRIADAMCSKIPDLAAHKIKKYDIIVSADGNGQFMNLSKAIEAAPAEKKTTIAITGGEWKKPTSTNGKKIKFSLLRGAKFVK